MDKNLTVNWIYPDKSLEKSAELKNVDVGEMVLLNKNDMHFNLVVPKDSDIVKLGSLSYRFNIGPTRRTRRRMLKPKRISVKT